MANIFTLEKFDGFSEKINIDELYETKKNNDLNKLALFQKILNRIHVRIKLTSKQKKNEQFCWFVVPEVIIGVPKYDQGECIAYIMDKLKENGFLIRYFHPNTLLISWHHWVPSYVRNELKKKTGIVVNEYGEKVAESQESGETKTLTQGDTMTNNLFFNSKDSQNNKPVKHFTPIHAYKPTGEFRI
uniref:Uncharacterized protein n=1 Tax=viral metagenome TaxID=1070528 RepID=A0A6C0E403_9ZZZZ